MPFKLPARRPRIGQPQQAPKGQQTRYKQTTIQVKPDTRVQLPTGGDYISTVLRMLEEIESFAAGATLIRAMTALGKNQIIQYRGPSVNQAAGGPMGYVLLRKYHDSNTKMTFAPELAGTIQRSGLTHARLAEKLRNQTMPHWVGGPTPSPFRNRPNGQRAEDLIPLWVDTSPQNARHMPTRDEMDILCLVLEPHLRPGPGVGTMIDFDPHKEITAGTKRPPAVGLFHELMHGYYNAAGKQLGREDSADERNGGRLFELMAVGLAPFDRRPFSENQLRKQWPGCPLRAQYP